MPDTTIPSYGLPDPHATAQAVISQLEANAADLAAVGAALQQGIGTAAGDSYQEMQRIQKALRSMIQRSVNYAQKAAQPPQQALAQALAAQAAMIQGTIPTAQALAAMPGPLGLPAGYPSGQPTTTVPFAPASTAATPPPYHPGSPSGPSPPGVAAPQPSVPAAGGPAAAGCGPDNPCYAILPGPGGCAVLEPVYSASDPLLGSAVQTFAPGQLAAAQQFLAVWNASHCGQVAPPAPSAPPAPLPGVPVPLPTPGAPSPVPAPPTPSPVTTPTTEPTPTGGTLTFDCPNILAAAISPESPGSVGWCQQVQAVHGIVAGIGQQIVNAVASLTDTSGLVSAIKSIPLVGDALNDLLGSGGVIGKIGCAAANAIAVVRAIVPCAAADYIALVALRAVLRSLEEYEVGTDALLWIVDHVHIPFDEVVRIVDYLIAFTCPTEIPGVPEALEAFLHGQIPEEQYRCWLLCRGCDPAVWEPVLQARRDRLTPQEAIEYGFRVGWTPEQIGARLRELGFLDAQDQAERLAMHFHLPTIGDQLHFLQRNVFREDYVQQYRLDEGFLERYWSQLGTQLLAIGVPQEVARLHYAAHWVNPAPTEMREFVYRLRPDKPGVQNEFTLDDYERLLVEQDVAPFFRERFRETVYRVPALSYIRDMYRSFIVDDEELRSIHQDLGYSPVDSERFLKVDRLLRARIRSSEAHGWTPAAVAQGYVSGVLTKQRVYAIMLDQGFQQWESDALMERADAQLRYGVFVRARSRTISNVTLDIQNGLDVGTWTSEAAIQALTDLGFGHDFAEGWVSVQQSRAQTRLVKQTITRLRHGYLRGELDDQGARAALAGLNITQEAVDRYLVAWSLSLTPRRRTLSKSEVLAEVCAGHMQTAEGLARLLNLGYSEEESGMFLADAGACLVKRAQQAALAEQRKASAAASQIQRLKREAATQARQLGSQARRLEPVSKLQKWARLGLITPDYFAQRLRSYGYSPAEIDTYWDEAAQAKGSQAKAHATASLHP